MGTQLEQTSNNETKNKTKTEHNAHETMAVKIRHEISQI